MYGRKTDRLSVLANASDLVSKTGIDPDILIMANNTQQQRNVAVSRFSSNSKSSDYVQNDGTSSSSLRMRELARQTVQSYYDEQAARDPIKLYMPPPSHISIGAPYSSSSRYHQQRPSSPTLSNLETTLSNYYATEAEKERHWQIVRNQETVQQLPATPSSYSPPTVQITKPSFQRHHHPTAITSPTPWAPRLSSYLRSPPNFSGFTDVLNMRMADSSTNSSPSAAYAADDEMVDDDDATISARTSSRGSSRQSYHPSSSAGGSSSSGNSRLGSDGSMDAPMSSEQWKGKLSRPSARKSGR